ncbi:MAG: YSIRK-type signal peptide-containing protein [Limosilactobacillus pontis]
MTLDREVPHYSLRKLGIGVVSVLLGTTMYFGANNTVANADEVVNNDNHNNSTSESTNLNNSIGASSVPLTSNSSNSQLSTVIDQSDQTDVSVNQTGQKHVNSTKTSAIQNMTVSQNNTVTNNVARTISDNKAAQKNSASITLDDGASLKTDNNVITNDNSTSTVIFNANEVKAGDTYTIRVPRKYIANIDAGSISNNFGEVNDTRDENYYYISDKFSKSGTVNQSISLQSWSFSEFLKYYNTDADSLYPGEQFNFNLSIKKNDGVWKELPFVYQIPTEIKGKLIVGPAHSLLYSEGTDPTSYYAPLHKLVASIPIHNQQEVQYGLMLNDYALQYSFGYNYTFNHGGTLTLTAPKYFTVDTTRPLVDVNGQKSDATINQNGNIITVHIPAGSKALVDSPVYFYGKVNAPDSFLAGDNTSLTFKNGVYTQQFRNNTSKQITGNDTSFVVAPKVPNKSDGYVYDIYYADSYNYVNGNYNDDYINGEIDGKNAVNTGVFFVTNAINQSRKNVKIHVDYSDGLNFLGKYYYASLTGNKNQNFKVTFTFKDGSKQTITSKDFEAMDHNVKNKKYIKSVDMVVDELDPGATVALVPKYYSIANAYSNGQPVIVGDSLKIQLV